MITFKQQFDKLTEAYIRGEVDAYDCKKCFVGNLLNGNGDWFPCKDSLLCLGGDYTINDRPRFESIINIEAEGYYTPEEIISLEQVFMENMALPNSAPKRYETALFNSFERALDHLKQIHESKGEIVEPFDFKKRELV